MSDTDEKSWLLGNRAAYRAIILQCAGYLAQGDPLKKAAVLIAERAEAIAALRRVCADHGDNDWKDDLYLADIIEKHLGRNLDRAAKDNAK